MPKTGMSESTRTTQNAGSLTLPQNSLSHGLRCQRQKRLNSHQSPHEYAAREKFSSGSRSGLTALTCISPLTADMTCVCTSNQIESISQPRYVAANSGMSLSPTTTHRHCTPTLSSARCTALTVWRCATSATLARTAAGTWSLSSA